MNYNNDPQLMASYRRQKPEAIVRVNCGHIICGCEAIARADNDAQCRQILIEAGYVEVLPNEFIERK